MPSAPAVDSRRASGVTRPTDEFEHADVAVHLERVHKRFGDVSAVAGVDLQIRDGEFFSLLGPSGSGKTTCLRMIAGFEDPTEGRILLHGTDVTRVPPHQRDVNTVFQDYALFPHMNVLENVAYGLMVRKVGKKERQERAMDALRMVRLETLTHRRPAYLSGGQQQRVALARALVNEPRVLLLDEPLGALDLKLREAMQHELKHIQQQIGVTFVFVTHDQGEALTMSDRIAVFNNGRVEQVASPSELYEQPASQFVAGFVGTSNVLAPETAARIVGEHATVAIRPEKIRLVDLDADVAPDECTTTGRVSDVDYLGAQTRLTVELEDGGELTVTRQNLESALDVASLPGTRVRLAWQRHHNLRLDAE